MKQIQNMRIIMHSFIIKSLALSALFCSAGYAGTGFFDTLCDLPARVAECIGARTIIPYMPPVDITNPSGLQHVEPSVGIACNKGKYPTMEDRHTNQPYFLAVFDGHNGSQVAEELSQRLEPAVWQATNGCTDSQQISAGIKKACIQTNTDINAAFKKTARLQGSTAAGCLFTHDKKPMLYAFNVGDSRIILVGKTSHKTLSVDQRVSASQEYPLIANKVKHIKGCKIQATKSGEMLVHVPVDIDPAVTQGLALSSTFGNTAFKKVGVTIRPEVAPHVIAPNDLAVVLTTNRILQGEDTMNTLPPAYVAEYVRRQIDLNTPAPKIAEGIITWCNTVKGLESSADALHNQTVAVRLLNNI
jgi:serine/threonine protein phosphatase PrpC